MIHILLRSQAHSLKRICPGNLTITIIMSVTGNDAFSDYIEISCMKRVDVVRSVIYLKTMTVLADVVLFNYYFWLIIFGVFAR